MVPVLLALTLLVGCGEDTKAPVAQTQQPAKAAPPSPAKQLEEARKAALGGKHEVALAQAEKVLARAPDEDGVWRLIEQEALAAGQARGLLERLDAAKAVGDRVGPHFLLRADLALAVGDYTSAIASAKLAAAADPSGAATLMARAALGLAAAGTPSTDALPPETLALLALAEHAATESEAHETAASAVTGWRAAMFRAEQYQAAGRRVEAQAEYAKAASDADPRAKIAANLARAKLAGTPGSKVPSAEAGAWAGEASKVALAEGSGAVAIEALELSVTALVMGGKHDDALASARELFKALPGELEQGLLGRAQLTVAMAADAAGLPKDALEAAAEARGKLAEDAARAEQASWIEGWSAWQLGRVAEITAAADRCSGQRQLALRGLAAMAGGDLASAAAAFPTEGLDPRDGARVYPVAAVADGAQSTAWLDRAIAAADASGDAGLRVSARLEKERWLRGAGDVKGAANVRAGLLALAAADTAGDPLRSELAARTLIDGGKASFPDTSGLPASVGVWAALSAGAEPPLAGDDPIAVGPGAWAEGRAAIARGASDQIFTAWSGALGKLPLHRQGSLALGTVLDGSDGLPLDADAASLTALRDEAPIDAWLAVHEVSHRLARFHGEALAGVDYTASLTDAQREPLRIALARARVGVRTWLAGQGPYPKEALAAYQSAESGLSKADGFGPLLPVPLGSPTAQLEKLGGVGIVSFRIGASGLHGVALSKRGTSVLNLGPSAKILGLAAQLRKVLEAGARGSAGSPVGPGDKLRAALLDPFSDVLSGVGRYLVIAPEPLDTFPLTALPEQSSGLRWLADIRNVAVLPSLGALEIPTHKIETYNPDFLGFGAITAATAAPAPTAPEAGGAEAAAGATNPEATPAPMAGFATDELAASSRVFSQGLKLSLSGPESKLQNWADKAKSARYIHFTGLEPSSDGGFAMADGPLTLAKIRSSPLGAQLVVIGAPGTMSQQRLRAQAFLDAGARSVLVSAWPIPAQARSRFFGAYYEAIGRDRTPARAVAEAREAFLRDALAGEGMAEPAIWGSFLLYGAP